MDALSRNADVQQIATILHSPACNGMLKQKNLVGKGTFNTYGISNT